MMSHAKFILPIAIRPALAMLAVLYFGLALALPAFGVTALSGSDFEKLEHDPIAAATCGIFLLCLPFGRKLPPLAISLLVLSVAVFAIHRGHPYGALIVLSGAMVIPRRDREKPSK